MMGVERVIVTPARVAWTNERCEELEQFFSDVVDGLELDTDAIASVSLDVVLLVTEQIFQKNDTTL